MGNRNSGRISQYRKSGGDQKLPAVARQLALLGATEQEMAQAFGVTRRTITNWEKEHPEFRQAIQDGRVMADATVADRLYQRACGYEHPEDKIFHDSKTGEPVVVPTLKHYPPDTTAAIFWLKNRQSDKWHDKQSVEHSGEILTKIERNVVNAKD